VKIYPNPVKDTLNINLGNIFSKEVHVRIYDISGRVMFKEYFKHNSKNLEINTSFLNKGVYFISLNLNGTDTRTQKFVKY